MVVIYIKFNLDISYNTFRHQNIQNKNEKLKNNDFSIFMII